MSNFWDSNVWGILILVVVLLGSLLVGNVLKRAIPFLRESLIPTSVLGGLILLLISAIFRWVTGETMFDSPLFAGKGMATLEIITYHALALGFIASTFKPTKEKFTGKRAREIFDSGVTTVSTYLLQAIFGLSITLIAALIIPNFFSAAGILLPFGYGQGTGQAMNYGGIYETEYGFSGGKSFGLAVAALGFLSASIGGVIHLNIQKKKGVLNKRHANNAVLKAYDIESANEIPMQESIDKLTIQVALIAVAYFIAYLIMQGLGALIPSMKSTIFGFNFLIGVISASLIKVVLNLLKKAKIIKRDYINDFLMTRTSNFFFDIMVVAGIAAISVDILERYLGILLILGAVGLVITYVYNRIVAKTLFKEYPEEQFLVMYGMLTGTASTGIILLREVDGNFETPAADNLVYQTLPAIVFGFPMMLLATFAPKEPILTLIILIVFFIAMNVLLFRSKIFKKKPSKIKE
ncbi:MAG: hypothetical protein IKL82_00310 [Clostridia bacterium]|nr:hypothetical protein [Clostridia bacterium]